jgi:hypothetical protein
MKALIIYVLLVSVGAVVAGLIGWVIEKNISATASLIAFLLMFFANFGVCWMATILIMDGTLKNWAGEHPPLPKSA